MRQCRNFYKGYIMQISEHIRLLAQKAKAASYQIAIAPTNQKNQALNLIADILLQNQDKILAANAEDMAKAKQSQLDEAMLERLGLNAHSVVQMAAGLREITALPDPVGEMDDFCYRPSGIQLGKMRVPLGVIGIIYEARPNVTADAAALCIKSGNACLLRGGSEAFNSNMIIAACIKEGLSQAGLNPEIVQVIDNTDRESVGVMLTLSEYIDVIVPRGGKGLVKRVTEEARIPVIKHLDGNCHVYIDVAADLEKAFKIALNAKTSRYGTCNTTETLLVHQSVAETILPKLQAAFIEKGVELRGCEQTCAILGEQIKAATEEDWFTEYLAPILAIKVVSDLNQAISHINHYGSHHTDAIVTENYSDAQAFLRQVDSASVMVNASTRFADGFEYGLGAEIGISTDKIHARGPVGLDGLTSQKWIVLGHGETR